eukprot:4810571-Pleurochrysis_carterae.AAC.2
MESLAHSHGISRALTWNLWRTHMESLAHSYGISRALTWSLSRLHMKSLAHAHGLSNASSLLPLRRHGTGTQERDIARTRRQPRGLSCVVQPAKLRTPPAVRSCSAIASAIFPERLIALAQI